MKVLLSSVFGPYGVNDKYGRKANKMELFHNQVTREQGLFSYRFHHNSFGLYFLAENISSPTTVLDFPTLGDFKRELKKGYDYVGISFIIPNFKKAQKMAELTRKLSPHSKIILGGHGVNVPDIEKLIEHDYLCKGEGVAFLRNLLGEDPNRPIQHPIMYGSFKRTIMGTTLPLNSGLLITGVGCQNKCRFCATSHFFNGYSAYLKTGQEIFDLCVRYEKEIGARDFAIMDENFLKMKDRAMDLIDLMEKNKKCYSFAIFSSAETLAALPDLDLLIRMGVQMIWIGVESKKEIYEKNKNIDFHHLIAELKRRGISILVSAILFLEEHDKKTIWDDIDFAISLKPDYLQFMELGPIPGTTLYKDYDQKGLLLKDVPYEEQHGQDKIWFKHPHFTPEESSRYIKMAFKRDAKVNGASFIRFMHTTLKGYQYTSKHPDERIRQRAKDLKEILSQLRYFFWACRIYKNNRQTGRTLKSVTQELRELFPKNLWKDKLMSLGVTFLATKEFLKIKLLGDRKSVRFFHKTYHMHNLAQREETQ